jgi:anti-sigma regulatory factor (Ser/Thr protein kinase)
VAGRPGDGYVHDALFYGSDAEALAAVVPFLRGGLDAGELVLVHAHDHLAAALAGALGDHPRLAFRPADVFYTHPARAVASFHRFFRRELAAGAAGFRVLGEITVDDDPTQLTEWGRYEAAITHVFAPYPIWGLCAFDTRTASPRLLAIAERTHPHRVSATARMANPAYIEPTEFLLSAARSTPRDPLEDTDPTLRVDDLTEVHGLRAGVRRAATSSGLPPDSVDQYVLAVNEIATNALMHGRPPVRIRLWSIPGRLLCTVSDTGPGVQDPFAGYRAVGRQQLARGGLGLAIARQSCDHLDFKTLPDGFTVRLALTR